MRRSRKGAASFYAMYRFFIIFSLIILTGVAGNGQEGTMNPHPSCPDVILLPGQAEYFNRIREDPGNIFMLNGGKSSALFQQYVPPLKWHT